MTGCNFSFIVKSCQLVKRCFIKVSNVFQTLEVSTLDLYKFIRLKQPVAEAANGEPAAQEADCEQISNGAKENGQPIYNGAKENGQPISNGANENGLDKDPYFAILPSAYQNGNAQYEVRCLLSILFMLATIELI